VPFVIDASVTLAWAFRDEQGAYAHAVLRLLGSDSARVPPVWLLEVANGVVIGERRGRIAKDEVSSVLAILGDLPIEPGPLSVSQALGPVLDLARTHRLSAYDASYLELAKREGVPLATQDDDMRSAAKAAGVALVS
jgi:predicted nucleic acid-binding protein